VIALAIVGLFLLLYGVGIPQDWYQKYVLRNRWKQPLKIGILYDMNWDLTNTETYAWTDINPNDWKETLEKFAGDQSIEVSVELINVNKNFDTYAAILNPYGGVYPEVDLKTLSTLEKIVNYVREGGVFVNVADIPSYWAYNPDLSRKLDTTTAVYGTYQTPTGPQILSTRPFELTPLAKTLGLRVAGIGQGFPQNLNQILRSRARIISKRAAIVEANIESCINPTRLRYVNGNPYDMSALFFVKYGEGDFLISLIWINDPTHTQQAKNSLRDAISKLLIGKLASRAI